MKIRSGCDIVKISRMEGFFEKGGLKRCFTENEEKYILDIWPVDGCLVYHRFL